MAASNEAVLIRHKLRGLTGQDYPSDKLAIIVVSDGSHGRDRRHRARLGARDPRIRLFGRSTGAGKPTALNLARRHITSDVTVLMDVRQRLTQGALRELVAQLADPRVGVVSATSGSRATRTGPTRIRPQV
jgi:cellulose synthase/poly-beta-1,6-N-acetylglucosamine synthase-like glycosyltransferase